MTYVKKGKTPAVINTTLKYFKKIRENAQNLLNNPKFNKEYQLIKKKCPLTFHPRMEQILRKMGHKGVKKLFRESERYQTFLDKWEINYFIRKYPAMKGTIKISSDKDDRPSLTIISKNATCQDIKDSIPYLIGMKEHYLGEAPNTKGRKREIERDTRIRLEFKRRKIKERPKSITEDLASREHLSKSAIRHIIYPQKSKKIPR